MQIGCYLDALKQVLTGFVSFQIAALHVTAKARERILKAGKYKINISPLIWIPASLGASIQMVDNWHGCLVKYRTFLTIKGTEKSAFSTLLNQVIANFKGIT